MKISYACVNSLPSYLEAVDSYDTVLINYHPSLFCFLDKNSLDETKRYVYVYHESDFPSLRDGIILNTDPGSVNGIPRPLAFNDTNIYPPSNVNNPTIGSFGFGFANKNFHQIVDLVQQQFDNATLRLLMPGAAWGDASGNEARNSAEQCRRTIRNPGIKLYICHDFMTDAEIFKFLGENDLNVFLYPNYDGRRGCSSVIDYVLGVNRPFAISDSHMFRHIYDDKICAYKTPLRTIIGNGPIINARYRELWSSEKLADRVKKLIGYNES
jgi:hypothetical protein